MIVRAVWIEMNSPPDTHDTERFVAWNHALEAVPNGYDFPKRVMGRCPGASPKAKLARSDFVAKEVSKWEERAEARLARGVAEAALMAAAVDTSGGSDSVTAPMAPGSRLQIRVQ